MQQTSVKRAKPKVPPLKSVNNNHLATLYLHIPFCISKCSYCSFNSYPVAGRDIQAYLEALLREAEKIAHHAWTQEHIFTSLYMGGGTPTMYKGEDLVRIIEQCLRLYPFSNFPEITIEANPNTLTLEKLVSLQRSGVNRLSIGVQSFSDRVLKKIGRAHSAKEAVHAVELARQAGFNNISIDLIYGLPGQNKKVWQDTLNKALELGPEHFSLYELMVEEGTPLAHEITQGNVYLPNEDDVLFMQEAAEEQLARQGYRRYEISNYAKVDYESRHNIHYWKNYSYVGLGAGAVSNISGMRLVNLTDPDRYISVIMQRDYAFQEAEMLGREASFRETLIMGLRMVEGVSLSTLKERYGIDVRNYYGETLAELAAHELLVVEDDAIRLTGKGLALGNQVLSRLV